VRDFAGLLDRLAFEPSRHGKITLLVDHFRRVGDPGRGLAVAALTDSLAFAHAKPALARALIEARVDPVLFRLSYDHVGDLSETVALLWPRRADAPAAPPGLAEVVAGLQGAGRAETPGLLAGWLDGLDDTGRWALLKLITGALRVGVSARLAKTALAEFGGRAADEIEEIWPGLAPPYAELFAWLEGRAPRPESDDPAPFRAPMLAHPVEDGDLDALDPRDFAAEWKWDGVRVQAVRGASRAGRDIARLYSRSGEDMSAAFPDMIAALLAAPARRFAIDGELLILREGRAQSFATLQQRLNRKSVAPKLIAAFPAHLRAYDLLAENEEDLRALRFAARRARLERLLAQNFGLAIDLSPRIDFADWADIDRLRAAPDHGQDSDAIEGVMLKRLDSPYLSGRPKGTWWKWKRDPHVVDAVLMYARRGHGKRSSFYSDFTFGVWRGEELTPVGKAYFGFTDAELRDLDRYVRANTVDRHGPVRVVGHGRARGLVLEVAFEGLARSARHKSGLAMRFPRISRIRWDKPAAEADRLEALAKLVEPRGAPAAAPAGLFAR
jgi:DNA ligase-1